MVERSKKRNAGSICEEDISILLQRYSVKTVLTLLQEVSKVSGEKIDWNAVAQNKAIGISSARECQMLWRHLAYRQPPIDQIDNDSSPMDDDSDLEYELEAFPGPSREAVAEAAACVKVLIASECPNDPDLPNNTTIEAPLTLNIPSCKNSFATSDIPHLANAMDGTNICIPVYVEKQVPSSGTGGEKKPKNGTSGVNNPPKKKRACSTEEDMKLMAAKKQCKGNWVGLEKADFDDRKPSELPQRWTNLKKNPNARTSSINSEAQLAAAHRAVNMALDMPRSDNWRSGRQMNAVGTKSQFQSQNASASMSNQQSTTVGPMKPQMPTKRPFMNLSATNGPDSMVKAAAVAAGARIATSADASSLIEATRSQNIVHIITGANPVIKSSSNVQFMRNNLSKAPTPYTLPSPSRPGEAQKAQIHSMKPAEPVVQAGPVGPAPMDKVLEDRSAPFGSSAPGNALRVDLPSSETEDNGKKSAENIYASKEIHGNTGPNGAVKQLKQPKLEIGK